MMNNFLSSELNNRGRKIKILTKSPNQCPDYDAGEEFLIDDHKRCLVVFDDMIENKQKDLPFFTRGRCENIVKNFSSQRYFELLLLNGDDSNIFILFKQTVKECEVSLMR